MGSKAEKLILKGRAQEKRGKPRKAMEYYRDACDLAKHDPDAWLARATLAETIGAGEEAIESWFRVADLCARGGLTGQAMEAVDRVLKLDPKHGGARRFKRMLAGRTGEQSALPPEAEVAEAAVAAPPSPADDEPRRPIDEPSLEIIIESVEPEPPPAPEPAEPTQPISVEPEDEVVIEAAPPPPPPAADLPRRRAASVPPPLPPSVPPRKPPPLRAAAAASSGITSETPVGRITAELALDELSLAEVLPGSNAAGATEIHLDDEHAIDLVQAVAATITTSPLLSELDSDLVKYLIDCGSLVHRAAGVAVFHEGDGGASLFLVLKGRVTIERVDPNGGEPLRLAQLRAGAFFGEMALLTNAPRSATVRAATDVDLLEISRTAVRTLIQRDGRVLKLLMRFFRARLVGTLLATSPLFATFNRDQRRELVNRFRLRELPAGHLVVQEGHRAEGLFLVLVGALRVTVGGEERVLGSLGPGDVFAEMSLLAGKEAGASVRTVVRSWVLLLGRDDFAALIAEHPQVLEQLAGIAAERAARNQAVLAAVRPV